MQPPPWIILLLVHLASCNNVSIPTPTPESDGSSGNDHVRPNRGIINREPRLIQYPTYYLAHSYTNQAGERQNVLIPVHPTPKPDVGGPSTTAQPDINHLYHQHPNPSPQIQPNGLPPTSSPTLTRAMLLALQNVPTRSPVPDYPVNQDSGRVVYTYPTQTPSQQYISPQYVKLLPSSPYTSVDRPHKSFGYTGHKLQQYKLTPNKFDYHRFRSRPDKYKYTATKLQLTTPSTYTNKVRFELEDAKVQHPLGSIALQPVQPETSPTPQTYTETGTTSSGLSQYYDPRNPKQFYYDYVQVPQRVNQGVSQQRPPQQVEHQQVQYVYQSNDIAPTPHSEHQVEQGFSYTTASPPHQQQQQPENVEYVQVPDNNNNGHLQQQYHLSDVHASRPYHGGRQPAQPQIQYVAVTDIEPTRPTPQPEHQYVPVTETNEIRPTPHAEVQYTPTVKPKVPPLQISYNDEKIPVGLAEAFNILKQTNRLPQRITPDNIDNSIKTLALILQRLQQEKPRKQQQQHITTQEEKPPSYSKQPPIHPSREQNYPQASGGSTPGKPGVDYPVYSTIPRTSFNCATQRYKGFFGDPETHCQVWHYCDLNGGQSSFLCPNGTIFNQVALTCDWWFNVRCSSTSQLYVLNERLYKYILPFTPSFPEDYSGPVVDRYLTAKFKEQEIKNRLKALKALATTAEPETASTTPEPKTDAATT